MRIQIDIDGETSELLVPFEIESEYFDQLAYDAIEMMFRNKINELRKEKNNA